EQRLDEDAEADERKQPLVIPEIRPDKGIECAERAGGFLRGIDDEVVIFILVIAIIRRRRGRLVANRTDGGPRRPLAGNRLLIRRSGHLFFRRGRFWRHTINRCCTAGMTARLSDRALASARIGSQPSRMLARSGAQAKYLAIRST